MKYLNTLFNLRLLTMSLVALSFLASCDPSDDPDPIVTGNVIVANEGTFGQNNASINFFNPIELANSGGVYETANGVKAGGIINSIYLNQNQAFLCVQKSNSVEDQVQIINAETGVLETTIQTTSTDTLFIPRNVVVANNKLYITNWGAFDASFLNPDSYVLIVDLSTNQITKKIDIPNGVDYLAAVGNEVFVAQSQGTNISVIDATTDEVSTNIEVPLGPKEMVLDNNGNIWAMCTGTFLSPISSGSLVRINPSSKAVEATVNFEVANQSASGRLAINHTKDKLYFVTAESFPSNLASIFSLDIDGSSPNSAAIISREGIYGLGVDPTDGTIYIGIAPDFVSNGTVVRYDEAGTELGSFAAGIAPKSFVFVTN